MVKEFSSIEEIRNIRNQKNALSEREKKLSEPLLTEYAMIPVIYEWFLEIVKSRDDGNAHPVYDRLKFLFIVLFLYAPGSLAGGKMPDGLRASLASTLKNISPCVISNNKKSASFYYDIYNRYRKDIEEIYEEIMLRLGSMKTDRKQSDRYFGKDAANRYIDVGSPYLWENY